eukprot:COSAG02_NODE_21987_length_767_cov_1.558383_1_plen_85_part_01
MGVKGLAAWLREEPQRRLFASERRHISTSDHRRGGSRQVDFVFDLHALTLYVHRSAGLDRKPIGRRRTRQGGWGGATRSGEPAVV